mgnify:CR=1 FL=1
MLSGLELVLSKLDGVRPIAGGYRARCPCHDDRVQSLSIREDNGKLLRYCHAGCSFEKIIRALDLPSSPTSSPPVITATYDYTDAEGKLLYQVVRYHPKNFKQRRPDDKGGWLWELKGITPTLYRLQEVIDAIKERKLLFIVEGEKDVENLRLQGQMATTISGGASTKWPPRLIPMFQGAKIVVIPDNDEPGRKYAQYVANSFYGWCSSLKVVALPTGKDVSDYLETQTIDNLLNIVYNTAEYIPGGAVTREEFESWRGVNQYLLRQLFRQKARGKSKYD